MRYDDATNFEVTEGLLAIEFDVDALYVFVDPRDKKRLAIAGKKGVCILNAKQALLLSDSLRGIVETYLEEKSC